MTALREIASAMRRWQHDGGESGGEVRAAVKAAANAIATAEATAVATALATACDGCVRFGGGSNSGRNNDGLGQQTTTAQHTSISPSPGCKVLVLSRFPLSAHSVAQDLSNEFIELEHVWAGHRRC